MGPLAVFIIKSWFDRYESVKHELAKKQEDSTNKAIESLAKIVDELKIEMRALKVRIDEMERSYLTLPSKFEAHEYKTDRLADAIKSMTQIIDLRMKTIEGSFGKIILKDAYNPLKPKG